MAGQWKLSRGASAGGTEPLELESGPLARFEWHRRIALQAGRANSKSAALAAGSALREAEAELTKLGKDHPAQGRILTHDLARLRGTPKGDRLALVRGRMLATLAKGPPQELALLLGGGRPDSHRDKVQPCEGVGQLLYRPSEPEIAAVGRLRIGGSVIILGMVSGWIVPEESGVYRFCWRIDDGGVILLNGIPLACNYEGGRWNEHGRAEVQLERGWHYLFQMANWDMLGYTMECTLQRRNGTSWEDVPFWLHLDADQLARGRARNK